MVLVLVKQTKELPVIFPVPAGVVHVHEAFVLDLARDLVEGRKNIRGGRTLRPKLFFLRQAERADAREKILRINAPRAPFAAVKLQLHRQAEINKRFQPRQQSRSRTTDRSDRICCKYSPTPRSSSRRPGAQFDVTSSNRELASASTFHQITNHDSRIKRIVLTM